MISYQIVRVVPLSAFARDIRDCAHLPRWRYSWLRGTCSRYCRSRWWHTMNVELRILPSGIWVELDDLISFKTDRGLYITYREQGSKVQAEERDERREELLQ